MSRVEPADPVAAPERRIRSGVAVRTSLVRVASFATARWAVPAAVAAVTFLAFLPALQNQWVEWDDQVILLNNEKYRGLGRPHLRWMFGNLLMGHYVPVTWLTYGLDYLLWGMKPVGYHLTSLLLHTANAVLVYAVALRILRKATTLSHAALRAAAVSAALFFALHPLRAESVAWATERRDVLSGLFFFATILTYLLALEREGNGRRWLLGASLGCFVLAIFSKSIVMTLPLVLILLDVYPLRRLPSSPRRWLNEASRRIWLEKLPFVVLGLVGASLGYYAQAANSYFTSLAKYPPSARVGMAFYSFWFYVSKTVVPVGLSPLYELPARVDPLARRFVVPMLVVLTITVGLVLLRKLWPAGLAAWAYYALVLGPVAGITHSGYQLAHDRYSYLSCLGFAMLVGGGVGLVVRAKMAKMLRPAIAHGAAAAMGAWLLGLAFLTWHQVQVWRDTDTLWRYAIESDPECAICHSNLGALLYNKHLPGLALEHFERELQLRPDHIRSHHSLALALAALGRTSEAIDHFKRVLAVFPNATDVLNNLGVALISQRSFDEALTHLQRAAAQDPRHHQVLTNLGVALTELGRPLAALTPLRRAVELAPREPLPRVALGRAHLALGDMGSARGQYDILRGMDARLASGLGASLISEW